jgi:hypothetical protein
MNRVLAKSTDAKVRNEARSVYHKARQALIDRDPLCKSWKRQAESIKKDMERACAVVREEFATFDPSAYFKGIPKKSKIDYLLSPSLHAKELLCGGMDMVSSSSLVGRSVTRYRLVS